MHSILPTDKKRLGKGEKGENATTPRGHKLVGDQLAAMASSDTAARSSPKRPIRRHSSLMGPGHSEVLKGAIVEEE